MRVEGCAWTVEKEEEEAEKLEKNSSPFVFLSFGRRLVLKRWSQKFSFEYFNFCFCAAPRYKNTRALLIRKPNTRRARKKTAVFALPLPPPLLRARVPFFFFFFFFFFLSISSVLLPVFARAGESFGKQKQRERERRGVEREGASVRFSSARIFLLLSLSRSLLLFLCFRAAASCSRLV